MKLADQGCNIAVIDVNLKSAEQTADEIKSRGLKAKAYKVDVTKVEEIKKLRDDLNADLGPVDILVSIINQFIFFSKLSRSHEKS